MPGKIITLAAYMRVLGYQAYWFGPHEQVVPCEEPSWAKRLVAHRLWEAGDAEQEEWVEVHKPASAYRRAKGQAKPDFATRLRAERREDKALWRQDKEIDFRASMGRGSKWGVEFAHTYGRNHKEARAIADELEHDDPQHDEAIKALEDALATQDTQERSWVSTREYSDTEEAYYLYGPESMPKEAPMNGRIRNARRKHTSVAEVRGTKARFAPRLKATPEEIARAEGRVAIVPEEDAFALEVDQRLEALEDRFLLALHEDDVEQGILPTSVRARKLTPVGV